MAKKNAKENSQYLYLTPDLKRAFERALLVHQKTSRRKRGTSSDIGRGALLLFLSSDRSIQQAAMDAAITAQNDYSRAIRKLREVQGFAPIEDADQLFRALNPLGEQNE